MEASTVLSKNAGTVRVKQGKNSRTPYPHQEEASNKLTRMNERSSFRTLLVLPTGAGKTMTAATWLLHIAVNNNKKVLWLAHRHLLLEQAADSFSSNAFSDLVINRQSFKYRIVSGEHDRPVHIRKDDDVLIVGKDSIIRNLASLDDWLKGEDEVYVVVDEAHHATARSYRRILEYVTSKVGGVKLIGLTATPFRTSEQEQGLLSQIFTDDIVHKVDLDTLIKKGILSIPVCESCDTEAKFGGELGLSAIKSIERLDVIPEDIAEYIADNKERNRFIVKRYIDNYKRYGQTLVFALNRLHALILKKLFEDAGKEHGIKAGVIMTGTSAEFIGIDISNAENERQIEAYRSGEIQVLINVNILTEGVDLPKTQTVFLTRPTVSVVLMTQMIGRALRGEAAGGTRDAYIVSFIDNWNDKIAWANPESILSAEGNKFIDKDYENKKKNVRIISIEKLEEFAQLVNDTVDTSRLEGIDFIKRVPLGMYVFTFIDENNMEHNHQILVYDNSKQRYISLIKSLPDLFSEFNVTEESIEPETLNQMIDQCEFAYFDGDMIPPFKRKDIEYLLKYFAQKESEPLFVPFDDVDRRKVDLSTIAKEIFEKDMRRSEQKDYIDSLWNNEASLLHVYFGEKYFFNRQLDTELNKLNGDFPVCTDTNNTVGEEISLEDLPLYDWQRYAPEQYKQMKELIFENARKGQNYICSLCGKSSPHKGLFQIDHVFPMAKGGKTVADNLQLLCQSCNRKKSDRA